MRYWDTSALVPLLVHEARSAWAATAFEADPQVITWWGTAVECVSALARLEREGALDAVATRQAHDRLDALELAWAEIQPSEQVRSLASRLLRVHVLRAGDALQLAAALTAAEGHPASLVMTTLDDRLTLAAEREGIKVEAQTA